MACFIVPPETVKLNWKMRMAEV